MPHLRVVLVSLFLALLLEGPAVAEETLEVSIWDVPVPFDERTVQGTLDNGLRWLAHPTEESSGVLELRLVVAAGSIHEDDDQRGVAHFVEHMAFNQTRRFSPGELRRFLETSGARFGADFNAVTDFRHTTYRLSVPSDDPVLREQAFEILADLASGIVFDPAEVERERGVVLAELAQKRETAWGDLLELAPALLGGGRYGERLPIGNRASLESLSAADLERFFDTWYRPDRMTVVAVGDLDAEEIEERLRRQLGEFRAQGDHPEDTWPLSPVDGPVVTAGGQAADSQVLMFHLVPRPEGSGRGPLTLGAIRQELVDAVARDALGQVLAEEIESIPWFGSETLPAVTTLWVSRRGRSFEDLARALEQIHRHGLPDSTVLRARSTVLDALARTFETEDSARLLANRYAAQAVGARGPADSLQSQAWKNLIRTVTHDEVSTRAQELVAKGHRRTLVVGGQEVPKKIAEVADTFDRLEETEGLGPVIDPFARSLRANPEPTTHASSTPEEGSASGSEAGDAAQARGRKTTYDEVGLHFWRLANGTQLLFRRTQDPVARMVAWRPGGVATLAPEDRASALLFSPWVQGVSVALEEARLQKRLVLHPQISALEVDFVGSSPELLVFQITTIASSLELALDTWHSEQVIGHLKGVAASSRWRLHERLSGELLARRSRDTVPPFRTLDEQLRGLRSQSGVEVLGPAFAASEPYVVTVAGNFEPDEILSLVEEHGSTAWGEVVNAEPWPDPLVWPTGPRPTVEIVEPREFSKAGDLGVIRVPGDGGQAQVQRLSHFELDWTPANEHELWRFSVAIQVLAREHLRESLGITYQVDVGAGLPPAEEGPGWISIGFATDLDHPDSAIDGVGAVIEFLLDEADPESALQPLLDQALEASAAQVPAGPPEAEGASAFWVRQLVSCYRAGIDPNQIVKGLPGPLSEERFRQLARRWLGPERSAFGVARPEP